MDWLSSIECIFFLYFLGVLLYYYPWEKDPYVLYYSAHIRYQSNVIFYTI
jgi:hypothetical protein